MSNKYRVYFKSVEIYYVDIEAESEYDAVSIAENTDGGDFELAKSPTWDFEKVRYAPEEA